MGRLLERPGGLARLGLVGLLAGLLLAAWAFHGAPEGKTTGPAASGDGSCVLERARNGWCEACGIGYVASLPIRSRALFDALDAHGHVLDVDGLSCATCKRLAHTDGFCESCRFGWLDGQAYMSHLTWALAKGSVHDPAPEECATCGTLWGDTGWCESCARGWTGNVAFSDRADYEAAAFQFGRLSNAIETAERCEACAMYQLVDGTCPLCRITWLGGERRGP